MSHKLYIGALAYIKHALTASKRIQILIPALIASWEITEQQCKILEPYGKAQNRKQTHLVCINVYSSAFWNIYLVLNTLHLLHLNANTQHKLPAIFTTWHSLLTIDTKKNKLKYKINERICSGLVYKNNFLETIQTAQLQMPGVG